MEKFKYLGVLFTSEGKMELEVDRWIGAASALMQALYWTVVVKRELSQKAKLSIYQSFYIPTFTYGHNLWGVTKRMRSWIQAAKMSFHWRMSGLSLRNRVRSSEILGVSQSRAASPLQHQKEPAEVVWAPV